MSTGLLAAEHLSLGYGRVRVVHDVTLGIAEGRGGVGLIGESGSGKTTLARALLGLLKPADGRVTFRGRDLRRLRGPERAAYRSQVQPVFQDGNEALDPRMRVDRSISEALTTHHRASRAEVATWVAELLSDVGLDPALASRRPHELSGGQRQRVIIARALAVRPRLLVLDEPTSALDVTVQARILDLLERLGAEHDLGLLLITHNLAVVQRLCAVSHVLFAGRVVESGPTRALLSRPIHPYTLALRDAVPKLGGEPPQAAATASQAVASSQSVADTGCAYRNRCPFATAVCTHERPQLRQLAGGRYAACHHAEQVLQSGEAAAGTATPA
ncbi:MAG TPA: ABC transporter ATP-binding protein [Planosporangium sp.]|jgi:peptide/nickel transport system ATP-binding protein|nr:ABC transporter ATP-binding protein [Planosporangium sp.]